MEDLQRVEVERTLEADASHDEDLDPEELEENSGNDERRRDDKNLEQL